MHRSAVLLVVLLCVALCFLRTASAAESEAAAAQQPAKLQRRPRSLIQACRKEITKICPEKREAMKCLSEKKAQITDEVCQTWLKARDDCSAAAEDKCKDSRGVTRACLRKIPTADLPESCTSTDYYKSVKLFGGFRRSAGKLMDGKDNLSKPTPKKPKAATESA